MSYNNFLSDSELNKVNELAKKDIWRKGNVISEDIEDYRIVQDVSILDYFPNIKNKVWNKISPYTDFDIDGIYEMNMLKYNPGGKYDWHQDVVYKHRKQRKYTFIIQLSDSNEYEGGDLEFFPTIKMNIDKDKAREKGTMIVFSSFLYHRITPITEGYRYSIVGWISGPPWK